MQPLAQSGLKSRLGQKRRLKNLKIWVMNVFTSLILITLKPHWVKGGINSNPKNN